MRLRMPLIPFDMRTAWLQKRIGPLFLCVSLLLFWPLTAFKKTEIWSVYLGNAARQNYVTESLPRTPPHPLWHRRLCEQSIGNLTLSRDFIIAETGLGRYVVLHPETGTVRDTMNLGTYSLGQIILMNQTLLYRTYHPVLKQMMLRAESYPGRIIHWQQPLEPAHWPLKAPFHLIPAGDRHFILWGGKGPRLALVTVNDSGPHWHDLVIPPQTLTAPPIVTQQYVIALVDGKWIRVFDVTKLQSKTFSLPAPALSEIALADARICALTAPATLVCLSLEDWTWQSFKLPEPGRFLFSNPKQFFILTAAGHLFRFNPRVQTTLTPIPGTFPLPSTHPIAVQNRIYIPHNRQILRLNVKNGERRESPVLPERPDHLFSLNNHLIVRARDYLFAWNHPSSSFHQPDWIFKLPCSVPGGFVLDPTAVYAATADTRIMAIHRSDGSIRWSYDTREHIVNPPLLHGSTLFVQNRDYQLLALNARTGERLWSTQTLAGFGFAMNHTENLIFYDSPGRLEAIRWRDRRVVWKSGQPAGPDVRKWFLFRPPAISGSLLALADSRQNLTVWDLTRKAIRWQTSVNLPQGAAPVIARDLLLIRERNRLIAFDLRSGDRRWVAQNIPAGNHPPATDEKYVYLCDRNAVAVIDLQTGRQRALWKWNDSIETPCTVTKNLILVSTRSGQVRALDRKTGKMLWTISLRYPVTYPIVASHKQLFLLSRDGFLYAYGWPTR